MGAKVAVDGDVKATAGSGLPPAAQSGTWTAATVSHETYGKLKVGGTKVAWKASCTFSFTGANSSGATVSDSETVTLTATTKLLQGGGTFVLVHGDSASGTYGNKLEVSASGALKSA